jgi:glycosyltransferase involved in cell wall biosynthesis
MKCSICYLTYNRLDYCKKSLSSIIQNTPRDLYELLLWDNGSDEEGMLDWLRQICQENKFDYVFCKSNHGLTTAMNNQMRIMKNRNHDIFYHIANDVVVPVGWLEASFEAIKTEKVGLIGLNLENGLFEKEIAGSIELEKLKQDGNVGGMHFGIPKRVFDTIGYFKDVKSKYGQQDANYSQIVKQAGMNWWIYYLPLEKFKGEHLGLLSFQVLTDQNKEKEQYHKYHEWMMYRLRSSGNDPTGGRNYRNWLSSMHLSLKNGTITKEQYINFIKVTEEEVVKVQLEDILETTVEKNFFESQT